MAHSNDDNSPAKGTCTAPGPDDAMTHDSAMTMPEATGQTQKICRRPLWRRILRMTGRTLGGLIMLILVLIGCALGCLQTAPGQKFFQDRLNAVLEPAGVVVSGFSGAPPLSTGCDLLLMDQDGPWLEVRNCLVTFDFADFPDALGLSIRAGAGHLRRLPPSAPAEETVKAPADLNTARLITDALASTAQLPAFMPGIIVRNIAITSFRVERSIYDPSWQTDAGDGSSTAASALDLAVHGSIRVLPDKEDGWDNPQTFADISARLLPVPAADVAQDASAAPNQPVLELLEGCAADVVTAALSVSGHLKDPLLNVQAAIGTFTGSGVTLESALARISTPAGWLPDLLEGRGGILRLGMSTFINNIPVQASLETRTHFRGLSPVLRLTPVITLPGMTLDGDITAVAAARLFEAEPPQIPLTGAPGSLRLPLPLSDLEGGINLTVHDMRLLSMLMPDTIGKGSVRFALDVSRQEKGHALTLTLAVRDVDIMQGNKRLAAIGSLDSTFEVANLDLDGGVNPFNVTTSILLSGKNIVSGAIDPFDADLAVSAALSGASLKLTSTGGLNSDAALIVARDAVERSVTLNAKSAALSVRREGRELTRLKALAADLAVKGIDMEACLTDRGVNLAGLADLKALSGGLALKLDSLHAGDSLPALSADMHLDGSYEKLALKLNARGGVNAALDLTASLAQRQVTLTTLSFSAPSYKCGLRLTNPVSVRFLGDPLLPVEVSRLNLEFQPSGSILCSGLYGLEELRASVSVSNLNTAPWQYLLPSLPPAVIHVNASLKDSPARPSGDVTVRVRDLTLPIPGLTPVSAEVKTAIRSTAQDIAINTSLSLDADTRKALGIQHFECEAGTHVPIRNGAPDFAGILKAPMEVKLRYAGTVSRLWVLAQQSSRRFSGEISLSANASGTPLNPVFNADMLLAKGVFRDVEYGVSVSDVTLKANASCDGSLDSTQVTMDFSCTDGRRRKGTVTASGSLHPVSMSNTDIKVSIRDFSPVYRRDLRASLSADVTITGLLTAPDVAGSLDVTQGRVLIEELHMPASSITTLKLVEGPRENVLALRAQQAVEQETNTGFNVPGSLNLTVTARRLFVEGFGLNSEWAAQLRATGALSSPAVYGSISATRGQLDILNRKFTLEEGIVSFSGGTEPFLNLKLTADGSNVDTALVLNGSLNRISDLKPQLESTPSMPENDILAYLLFDKPASELSQFELLQLAQSMATLTAFGTGSKTRNVLRAVTGLDVINLGQNEEGHTSLEMGKYLLDNVYAGVEKSADANSETRAIIRWELGRHTSAGVRTGGDETSAGLKWRMDY